MEINQVFALNLVITDEDNICILISSTALRPDEATPSSYAKTMTPMM